MSLDTAKAVSSLRDLTVKFDKGVRNAPIFYPEVCTIQPSNGADEKYAMLGDVKSVREWLGDRIFNELRASSYVLLNKLWENSLAIKKTDIDDDRLGIYGSPLEMIGAEAAQDPDKLLFDVLIAGSSSLCWDGQYFYDTDHSWGDSGTQSNALTYDAADHTNVTALEFLAAFHQARKAMVKFKNDQGNLLNRPVIGRMSDLVIVVPPELRVVAETALNATVLNNNTNIVIDRPRIVESAYLTSAVKWYLFKVGDPIKPFIFQAREPISRQMKGTDDKEFKDVKFMTQARYNVGYGAWWQSVQTTFN